MDHLVGRIYFLVSVYFFRVSCQIQGTCHVAVGSRGKQHGKFRQPRGLALTPDEAFLLVVDAENHRVALLQATDGAWVQALKGPSGTLPWPSDVVVVPSTGEVLVSDSQRHQVVRFRSLFDDTIVGTLGTGEGDEPCELDFPGSMVIVEDSSVHLSTN